MLIPLLQELLLLFCIFLTSEAETNRALYKPAKSSSIYPWFAIVDGPTDGHSNTIFNQGNCFGSSTSDVEPWWQVDLQTRVFVTKVKVIARSDCCSERLHDIVLDVFTDDSSINPQIHAQRCYNYRGNVTFVGGTVTLTCVRPVSGRFLRIRKRFKWDIYDGLEFCELQVFGETKHVPYESCSSFTMLPGKRLSTTAVESTAVTTRSECAALCEQDVYCWGFNLLYNPEVTCQLVQDPDIDAPVVDASSDGYKLNPCFNLCK